METSGSYLSSSGQFVAGVVADTLWTVFGSRTILTSSLDVLHYFELLNYLTLQPASAAHQVV